MTTKRRPWGRVCTAGMGSMHRSRAFTHGPQARKRSATDWSVMDSYRTVKMPATSRKGLSKPQYKKTTRKSCAGVLTFLARTNALNSRAICMVSGGRSCKSSSKSVSGSVRGNCIGRFSCRQQGKIFTSCSMPSFSPIYSLSWRLWEGADPCPIGRATPPAFGGGQDVAAGRKVARHPRHKAGHTPGEQSGHAEPGVDHEDFVGLQGRSGLRDGPALQRRFMAVA